MNTLNSIKLYLADTISEQLQIKKDFNKAVIDALTKTRNKNFCNDCKYNLKEKCEGCITVFISNEEQQEQLVFIDNCLYDEICKLQYKYHIGIIGCCCGRKMNNIVKDYSKVGNRNQKAIEHGKLAKHMMHLVRLYLMAFDILERKQIITYRTSDHNLLMDIRNGKYLSSETQPSSEFFELVDVLEKRLDYAKLNTDLPNTPNYNRIKEFIMSVNEKVVKEEV